MSTLLLCHIKLILFSWKLLRFFCWSSFFFAYGQLSHIKLGLMCLHKGFRRAYYRRGWYPRRLIELFSLYVLFSQKRSRGNLTLCLVINYAYLCTWIWRNLKETVPQSIITWPVLWKQNVQAKEVRDRARKSACKPAVAVLIRIRFAFAGVYFCFKMS